MNIAFFDCRTVLFALSSFATFVLVPTATLHAQTDADESSPPAILVEEEEWVEPLTTDDEESPASDSAAEDAAVAPAAATAEVPAAAAFRTNAVVALSPESAKPFEQMLTLLTGMPVEGIDPSKPWGALVMSDGNESVKVYCLPVSEPEKMLALVEAQMQVFGAQLEDGENGMKKLATPFGLTFNFLPRDGWMYVSPSATALNNLPDNPPAVFGKILADYAVGAQILLRDMPESERKEMLEHVKAMSDEDLELRKETLSEQEFEIYRRQSELMVKETERWINSLGEVSLGASADPQQPRGFFDIVCRFQPESALAKQVESAGRPRTNFAGFYQPDATATVNLASVAEPITHFLLALNRDTFPMIREQAERVVDNEGQIPDADARDSLKSALNELLVAVEATLQSDEFDGAASFVERDDAVTLVAGGFVKQPDRVEAALKQLEPRLPLDPEAPAIQWNAAEHKDVHFHTFRAVVPEADPQWRERLGETVDVTVGIGDDAVYFAMGDDNLDALRQAIDASEAEPNKEVPPLDASVALGPFLPLAANWVGDDLSEVVRDVASQLRQDAQDRDRVRLTATLVDGGLRYRVEADDGVLAALQQLGAMAAPGGANPPMMWPPQQ